MTTGMMGYMCMCVSERTKKRHKAEEKKESNRTFIFYLLIIKFMNVVYTFS